jgi:hypothetical protein
MVNAGDEAAVVVASLRETVSLCPTLPDEATNETVCWSFTFWPAIAEAGIAPLAIGVSID